MYCATKSEVEQLLHLAQPSQQHNASEHASMIRACLHHDFTDVVYQDYKKSLSELLAKIPLSTHGPTHASKAQKHQQLQTQSTTLEHAAIPPTQNVQPASESGSSEPLLSSSV